MQKRSKNRLVGLDGLRGFAIILVFLDHINIKYIIKDFPIVNNLGVSSSGILGVSFLFILSGFLMSYLYPQPQSRIGFIQKRYTRIFPLFLSMCVIMLLLNLTTLGWWEKSLAGISIVILVHSLWVYGIKKIHNQLFSRLIFLLFVFIQIVVGIIYAFWVMRYPPAMLDIYPYFREVMTGLVNITLTFPLGNYLPMLDGVYWSLASEILFYILYPTIIIPLIFLLIPQKRIIKILFLISLMPLLVSLDIISHHIFLISALQLSLFYYFATGIALGYMYRNSSIFLYKFWNIFRGKYTFISIILLFFIIIFGHFINDSLSEKWSPWTRIFLAIPLTAIVALTLDAKNGVSKFFSSKILIFIGMISYSIYLSHSVVISTVEHFLIPTNTLQNFIFILFAFFIGILIAYILYVLLEKPYFIKRFEKPTTALISSRIDYRARSKIILASLAGVFIISIIFAFQSTFNFSSIEVSNPKENFVSNDLKNEKTISMKSSPNIYFELNAKENNFGIVSVSIEHILSKEKALDSSLLTFSIKEKGKQNTIFSSNYVFDQFRGTNFPFGFPAIKDAKGKTYLVNLSLTGSSNDDLIIDTTSIKSVYQLEKSVIITNPNLFLQLINDKFNRIYENDLAKLAFLLQFPFLVIVIRLLFWPSKIRCR